MDTTVLEPRQRHGEEAAVAKDLHDLDTCLIVRDEIGFVRGMYADTRERIASLNDDQLQLLLALVDGGLYSLYCDAMMEKGREQAVEGE